MLEFLLEILAKAFVFLKRYWRYAYKNRMVMYFIILAPAALIVCAAAGGFYYFVGEYNKTIGDFSERRYYLYKESVYRYALDNLAVCLDSEAKQLNDAEFFCRNAMEAYKNSIVNDERPGVAVEYNHKSYSLVGIDLAWRLRILKMSLYELERPSSRVLDNLMFRFNFLFIVLGIGCSMAFVTAVLFYVGARRRNS